MSKWVNLVLAMVMAGILGAGMVSAAEGKQVAIVRIQEVFRRSEYAKQMETQIRASFQQEERAIEDMQKLLQTQQEKLQPSNLLDPDSYQYKEQVLKLQLMELKLRDMMQNYATMSRTRMATFWRSVYADFQNAIKSLASTGKYSLILSAPDVNLSEQSEKSNAPEAVMTEILQRWAQYVSPEADLTEQVIAVMNEFNKNRVNR